MYDLLIPGHFFCDLIFTGLPAFPSLGAEVYSEALDIVPGGVLNSVIGAHRLGLNVAWRGALGTDMFSQYISTWLQGEELDLALVERVDKPLQRVTVSLSYPNDRAFVTYVDPIDSTIEFAFAALEQAQFRHLHFTGLQVDPRTSELLTRAKAQGATLSMDCQTRPETLNDPIVPEVLSHLDFFMPNAGEARKLTGESDLANAAAKLLPYVPLVIIKDGANGVHAWTQEGYHHQKAISVQPVDTTGAGDCFNAGYLTAYLEGEPLETRLRWGCITGGLSTLGRGGATSAPTRAQMLAYQDEWV